MAITLDSIYVISSRLPATLSAEVLIRCAFLAMMLLAPLNAYSDGLNLELSNSLFSQFKLASVDSKLTQARVPDALIVDKQRKFRTQAIILTTAGLVGFYGSQYWWKDGFTSDFHSADEEWFGQNTYAGGADKLGHAYVAYVGTRLLSKAFVWAGNNSETSLKLSTATIFGAMIGVEILDGYSRNFDFSKEDAISDALGAILGYQLEKHPDLDALVDFRVQYWPSTEARKLGEYDPIEDTSGQTYLLAIKAKGVPVLRKYPIARYLELVIGYGSRGYKPVDGITTERSRHVYLGVSLNMTEVLATTVFQNNASPSRAQRITDTTLKYIQIPGTAAAYDHKL